jgi:hypothetical protein
MVRVREATLVNDEASIDITLADGLQDTVVAHLDRLADDRRSKPQQAVGCGVAARDGDASAYGVGERQRRHA